MLIRDFQENYSNGWVKLYRAIDKHWLWEDKPFTKGQAWIDILLECNHSERKVNIRDEIIICDRGESLNSLDTWAIRWGWNKSRVRRFLKLLKSDSMIELKTTHKTTHLRVCNYETYQDKRNDNETILKHKRNDDETILTLNKNDKNVKNDKNIIYSRFVPPTLEELTNYICENNYTVDPSQFIDFYQSKGWMVGKNKMKDWKAAVRNWEKRNVTGKHGAGATPDELAAIVARRFQKERN